MGRWRNESLHNVISRLKSHGYECFGEQHRPAVALPGFLLLRVQGLVKRVVLMRATNRGRIPLAGAASPARRTVALSRRVREEPCEGAVRVALACACTVLSRATPTTPLASLLGAFGGRSLRAAGADQASPLSLRSEVSEVREPVGAVLCAARRCSAVAAFGETPSVACGGRTASNVRLGRMTID